MEDVTSAGARLNFHVPDLAGSGYNDRKLLHDFHFSF